MTIEDLVAWRTQHGDDVDRRGGLAAPPRERVHATHTAYLPTRHGDFRIHGYRDLRTGDEHVALVADGGLAEHPVVRVHSECLTGDAFGSARCDCGPQLDAALELAAEQGGAVVYLRGHEGRGIGLLAKVRGVRAAGRRAGTPSRPTWTSAGRPTGASTAPPRRSSPTSASQRISLLTNNPAKVAGLRAHGIDVARDPRPARSAARRRTRPTCAPRRRRWATCSTCRPARSASPSPSHPCTRRRRRPAPTRRPRVREPGGPGMSGAEHPP